MSYDLDVLLPFHKNNLYLEDAISSLAASKAVKFNTILIDDRIDQSKDLTHIFRQLRHFDIVKTPGGTGYAGALELGTRALSADATALFNSDDLIHPSRLIKQIATLDRNSISFTKIRRINSKGQSGRSLMGIPNGDLYHPIFLLLGSYGANASWCMRTEWWKKKSFFDSNECLDWRIAMNSFKETSIAYLPQELYFYRKHNDQATSQKNFTPSELEPVYRAWLELAKKFHLKHYSYSTFASMAVPWNQLSNFDGSELRTAVRDIIILLSNLDFSLQSDVKRLLKRRFVLALRNQANLATKIKLSTMGMSQIPAVLLDFLA